MTKWFRWNDGRSAEAEAPDTTTGAPTDYAGRETPDAYDEDTSFNWRDPDSSSSAIFDSPDTHRVRILNSRPARPANDDNNRGYDPYDTGRFKAENDD